MKCGAHFGGSNCHGFVLLSESSQPIWMQLKMGKCSLRQRAVLIWTLNCWSEVAIEDQYLPPLLQIEENRCVWPKKDQWVKNGQIEIMRPGTPIYRHWRTLCFPWFFYGSIDIVTILLWSLELRMVEACDCGSIIIVNAAMHFTFGFAFTICLCKPLLSVWSISRWPE